MKNILTTLAVLFGLSLCGASAQAQCSPEAFMDDCNGKLAEGYTYLKSYSVDGAKASENKVEYSYVFSKDTNYLLTLCGEGAAADNIVVTLYDSQRRKLVSSYDKKSDRHLPAVGIRISATGIYYLAFEFSDENPQCGGSVLAFKR